MNIFTISKLLMMNMVENELILNGNTGTIFDISVLNPSNSTNPDLIEQILIAFCTSKKVFK